MLPETIQRRRNLQDKIVEQVKHFTDLNKHNPVELACREISRQEGWSYSHCRRVYYEPLPEEAET